MPLTTTMVCKNGVNTLQQVSIAQLEAPVHMSSRLDNIIMPKFWTGTPAIDPAKFTIDAGGKVTQEDLKDDSELANRVRDVYDKVGLVHVVNTGLTDLEDMSKIAKFALPGQMNYESGANAREAVAKNIFEVGAPLSAHLHYHHEMAYVSHSTKGLAFMCKHATPGKGATYFSDSVAATEHLKKSKLFAKLRDRGVCYHRKLTDRNSFVGKVEEGVYNHWQRSFDTEDRDIAEQKARASGLTVEWAEDGTMITKYYASAFEYFEPLGKNIIYSSVADHGMWFDGWPLVMHLPYEKRPLHMTFGDGSEFTREELEEYCYLNDKFGIEIQWKEGELVIFCNWRFAHGRPGMTLKEGEQRELGVMLGEKFQRQGWKEEGW